MKVLQKELPNPKAQKSVGKKLAWPQVKFSTFVRVVPGSFWVLFLNLPLNHATLVNWVTCSLIFSIELYVFHLSQYYWKSQWGQSNWGLHTESMAWQGFTLARELQNGIWWVGNAGLAAVSLVTRSYIGAARLDCFSNAKRLLGEPYFKGNALLASPDRKQGFVAAPSELFAEIEAQMASVTTKPQVRTLPSRHTEYLKRERGVLERACLLMLHAAEVSPQNTSWWRCPWPLSEAGYHGSGPAEQFPQHCFSSLFLKKQLPSLQSSHLYHAMSEKWDKSQKICLSQALNKTSDLCNTCKALTLGTSCHQASVNQQRASPQGLWRC